MKIEIGQKIEEQYLDCFVLYHDYMIGDADGNYYFEDVISKDNPFLIQYLEFLNSLDEEVDYECLDEFISELDNTVENYDEYIKDFDFEVKTEDDLGMYSYQGYDIYFFDEKGDKFEVKIIE